MVVWLYIIFYLFMYTAHTHTHTTHSNTNIHFIHIVIEWQGEIAVNLNQNNSYRLLMCACIHSSSYFIFLSEKSLFYIIFYKGLYRFGCGYVVHIVMLRKYLYVNGECMHQIQICVAFTNLYVCLWCYISILVSRCIPQSSSSRGLEIQKNRIRVFLITSFMSFYR